MISESFLIRPRGNLLRNLVLFARLLRSVGVPASPDQLVDLARALPLLDLRRKDEFKDAARATLVTSREQAAVFDRTFDLFWRAWSTEEQPMPEAGAVQKAPPRGDREDHREDASADTEEVVPEGQEQPDGAEPETLMTYSAVEVLRAKDFAKLSEDELHSVTALIRTIEWRPDLCRTRRKRRAAHGAHLDLRRALRYGLRYGGETIELAWQRPKLKRRPLVVLCDISGSMELYSRILLQFLYALTNGLDHVEAFVFGTRLTHLTRQLRQADVDEALRQAAGLVNDWGGGTRIGESLKTFNYDWARRVLGHGATVLIISDGWDRGDLTLLRREISRLQLSCRHLIWLNPLLGAPGYEPLAQGIQAVLPFVDDFLPVHNVKSLERLASILEQTTGPRSEPRAGRSPISKWRSTYGGDYQGSTG
jgi:uncharacterized protein with von Willebrand factor type A (vWA) domain